MSRTLRTSILFLTALILLPEFSRAQETSQSEIQQPFSWIYEGEVTQGPLRVACRPVTSKEELAKQTEEWMAIWNEQNPACGCKSGSTCSDTDCGSADLGTLGVLFNCLLYTSPSPRDATLSRMPSSA